MTNVTKTGASVGNAAPVASSGWSLGNNPITNLMTGCLNGCYNTTKSIAYGTLKVVLLSGADVWYNRWGTTSNLGPNDQAAVNEFAEKITGKVLPMLKEKKAMLAEMIVDQPDAKSVKLAEEADMAKDIEEYANDSSVGKFLKNAIGCRLAHAIEKLAAMELEAVEGESDAPIVGEGKVKRALSNALRLAKPFLAGNRERFVKASKEYEHNELLYDALSAYRRAKLITPNADFDALQQAVDDKLGEEKADMLFEVVREFLGDAIDDEELLESFFSGNIELMSAGIQVKQKELLENTFQPLSAELLTHAGLNEASCWTFPGVGNILPKVRDEVLPGKLLLLYGQSMQGPAREGALVNDLSARLFLGLTPEEKGQQPVGNISHRKRLELREKAGTTGVAKFLDNALSVAAKDISEAIRGSLHTQIKDEEGNVTILGKVVKHALKNNKEADGCFDFVSEHVKVGLLKLLNNIAKNNIDNVSKYPEGRKSKALPTNALLNFSAIWDKHKVAIGEKLAAYRAVPDNVSEQFKKAQFLGIFRELTADIVRMGGINPLEDLPGMIFSDEEKEALWEDIKKETLPEIIGELCLSLTQWEADKSANEASLESRSEYAVGAMRFLSRYIVEKAQNHLATKPEKVGESLKDVLSHQFKAAMSVEGNAANEYLHSHEPAFQKIVTENLPPVAQNEPLWESVESALHPTLVKLFSGFMSNLGAIESKNGSLFFRDFVFEVSKRFSTHLNNINTVTHKAHENNPIHVDRVELFEGLVEAAKKDHDQEVKNEARAGQKGSKALLNESYVAAKKRVLEADAKVKELSVIASGAATAFKKAKQLLGIKWGTVSKKAEQTVEAWNIAQAELKEAQKLLDIERKKCLGEPLARKILAMVSLHSADDLPLPPELSGMKKQVWELLVTEIMPTMLHSLVQSLTDKDMTNKILTGVLEKIREPVEGLEQVDPYSEIIRIRLESIAAADKKYGANSGIAKKILAGIANGQSVEKAVGEIMAHSNDSVLASMKAAITQGCGAQPLVDEKWEKWVSPEVRKDQQQIQDHNRKNAGGFDAACGELLKGMVDMLPHRLLSHINILKIQSIRNLGAEAVGSAARESLEKWTMQKIINDGLASALPNLLPDGKKGKWVKENGKQVFTVLSANGEVQQPGYTHNFNLALTPEAKSESDIKAAFEQQEVKSRSKQELVNAIDYQFKGIFKNMLSKSWNLLLDWVYKVIDISFGDRAPELKLKIKNAIAFCLNKMFVSTVERFIWFATFPIHKLFWFILDHTYISSKADKIIDWLHMQDSHEELIWDSLEVFADQFTAKSAEA